MERGLEDMSRFLLSKIQSCISKSHIFSTFNIISGSGNECSPCKACKNRKCKENFVRLFGIAIRISRIRKPIFHVRTDTEKSRS